MLFGCDFSSAPTARKPIVVATGDLADPHRVVLTGLQRFATLDAWGEWLRATPDWVGGFDFPFGLPRELVEHLRWPTTWHALITHYASLSRAEIRDTFAAFCAARPVGGKFAHRATDLPAGSSPSMKWVNPPVAYMLHAGVPRLLAAGACIPGLHDDGRRGHHAHRVALEAYPGLLARELIGRRSYKSDDLARQTPSMPCCASCRPPGASSAPKALGPVMVCRPVSIRLKDGSSRLEPSCPTPLRASGGIRGNRPAPRLKAVGHTGPRVSPPSRKESR